MPRSSRIMHRFAKSSADSFLRGLWFSNQYLKLGLDFNRLKRLGLCMGLSLGLGLGLGTGLSLDI